MASCFEAQTSYFAYLERFLFRHQINAPDAAFHYPKYSSPRGVADSSIPERWSANRASVPTEGLAVLRKSAEPEQLSADAPPAGLSAVKDGKILVTVFKGALTERYLCVAPRQAVAVGHAVGEIHGFACQSMFFITPLPVSGKSFMTDHAQRVHQVFYQNWHARSRKT